MTTFTAHTIDSAPAAAKPLLEGAKASLGFVPNLFANMAQAPALLEGYLSLMNIVGKTDLSETECQIILMTNNRLNGCEYCMAAHTTLSQMANVADEVIESLRAGTPIADNKLEALRQFAIIVNETRGNPSDAQIQALLDAGYTQQTVLEVVLATAFKVLSNYTNHITGTQIDDAFKPNEWSKAA